MEKFDELVALVEATRKDAEKFFVKGNKAAGTRVRKAMQSLKVLAQEIRVVVQETKSAE